MKRLSHRRKVFHNCVAEAKNAVARIAPGVKLVVGPIGDDSEAGSSSASNLLDFLAAFVSIVEARELYREGAAARLV